MPGTPFGPGTIREFQFPGYHNSRGGVKSNRLRSAPLVGRDRFIAPIGRATSGALWGKCNRRRTVAQ